MLKPNRVKQALKRGEPVVGTMISESNSTGFIWMLANVGFDYVFIDMEHGAFDLPAVADMIKVARLANLTPLVRVPDLAYHLVAQALDAGAIHRKFRIGQRRFQMLAAKRLSIALARDDK